VSKLSSTLTFLIHCIIRTLFSEIMRTPGIDLDRVFRSFALDVPAVSCRSPRVHVREEEGGYVLKAELPGKTEKENGGEEHKRRGSIIGEPRSSPFSRSFVLPKDVDREHIAASFTNGLLRLDLPKAEAAKPKRIEVKKD